MGGAPERNISRRQFLGGAASLAIASAILPASALAEEKGTAPERLASPEVRALLERLFQKPGLNAPKEDPGYPEESAYFQERVEGWRQHYLGNIRDRERLTQGFDRLLAENGKHLQLIHTLTEKGGIPFEVVFLALAESHWHDFGENGAKAAGYWQFVPATAKQYGLQNVPVTGRTKKRYSKAALLKQGDERLDAEKATVAAIRYLKNLLTYFEKLAAEQGFRSQPTRDDLWAYAMWAYNRGQGHVKKSFVAQEGKAIRYSHDLVEEANSPARRESANYVPKIWGIRAALAEIFELTPGTQPKGPLIAERKGAPGAAHRKTAHEKTPKKISPADQRYATLPESPGNSKDAVAEYLSQLHDIRELYEKEAGAVHSRAYTTAALAIIDARLIAIQKEFPEYFSTHAGPLSTRVDDTGDVFVEVKKKAKVSPEREESAERRQTIEEIIEYRVQTGDTLDKIATWLTSEDDRATIADIKRTIQTLNPGLWKHPNLLRRHENLRVPAEEIVVRRGDTLDKIAREHYDGWPVQVGINMLKWLNGITPERGSTIKPGQKLRVPAI